MKGTLLNFTISTLFPVFLAGPPRYVYLCKVFPSSKPFNMAAKSRYATANTEVNLGLKPGEKMKNTSSIQWQLGRWCCWLGWGRGARRYLIFGNYGYHKKYTNFFPSLQMKKKGKCQVVDVRFFKLVPVFPQISAQFGGMLWSPHLRRSRKMFGQWCDEKNRLHSPQSRVTFTFESMFSSIHFLKSG